MINVSVIIPSFNGAHKLPIVLQSLSQQIYKDFELIIVLDGSTDNSIQIIELFEKDFNKFKIIHQENKGRACT
ncbi:MAG: glycosyltransferase, partial [Bacteroidota bacterium]|nr:glycosyltransferase [Bacteroidota bacterium]